MADTQPAKPKRVVRNPETFRERAIKAADGGDKPRRGALMRRVGGKLVRPVTGTARKAAGIKPFRPLRFVLRIIGRVLFPKYFRQSWYELRQVHWPSLRESRQLTFAVLVFAVVFGVVIAIVDFGLDRLFRDILLK